MIPIYELKIPEYRINKIESFSGEIVHTEFGTPVPIEYWNNKPDFSAASIPIVDFLRKHHMNQKVGLRLLGSMEHPDKTIDEVIEIIRELGHDRYDPNRSGNQYENIENKKIEIFALEIQVGKENGDDGEEQIKHALQSFYIFPISKNSNPVKIDIGIVYNIKAIESVAHQYKGRESEVKKDGFRFKNLENKKGAVLEIIKIV